MTRNSILTKDNLLRRGWKGSKFCVFYGHDENIKHLFFQCSVIKLIWCLFQCAFDLRTIPENLNECFGRWLKSFSKDNKQLVLVGFSAILWTIWRCQNDVVF